MKILICAIMALLTFTVPAGAAVEEKPPPPQKSAPFLSITQAKKDIRTVAKKRTDIKSFTSPSRCYHTRGMKNTQVKCRTRFKYVDKVDGAVGHVWKVATVTSRPGGSRTINFTDL